MLKKIEKKLKTVDELMWQRINKTQDKGSMGGVAYLLAGVLSGMISVFSIFML